MQKKTLSQNEILSIEDKLTATLINDMLVLLQFYKNAYTLSYKDAVSKFTKIIDKFMNIINTFEDKNG